MTPPPVPPNFMGGPMRPGVDGMRPPMMMPPAGTPGMPVAGPFPGPGIPGAGFPVPAFRGIAPVPAMAPPGNLFLICYVIFLLYIVFFYIINMIYKLYFVDS